MAQSVSNDALWEKLLEIEKKLDRLTLAQKAQVPIQENTVAIPDCEQAKKELIAEIKEKAYLLGKHNDSHFEANRQNLILLNENIVKVLKLISGIQKQLLNIHI